MSPLDTGAGRVDTLDNSDCQIRQQHEPPAEAGRSASEGAAQARSSHSPEPARKGSEEHAGTGSVPAETRLSASPVDVDKQLARQQQYQRPQQPGDTALEPHRLDLVQDGAAGAVGSDADVETPSGQAREDEHTAAATAVEDTDESTQSQPVDEMEPSQDNSAGHHGDLGDDEDVEVEASQEAPARESTIDRGNYGQYKTEADEDEAEDKEEDEEAEDEETTHLQLQSGDVDLVDAREDPTTAPATARDHELMSGVEGHVMPSTPSLSTNCVPEAMTRSEVKAEVTTPTTPVDPSGGSDGGSVACGVSSPVTEIKRETESRAHPVDEDRVMEDAEPYQAAATNPASARAQTGDVVSAADQEVGDDHDEQAEVSVSKANELTRTHTRAISSSDSETESDNDNAVNNNDSDSDSEEPGDGGVANGLEAALKAAANSGASVSTTTSHKSDGNARASRAVFSLEATGDVRGKLSKSSSLHSHSHGTQQKKKKRSRESDSDSESETTGGGAGKRVVRPRSQLETVGASISSFSSSGGRMTSTSSSSSIKSTLLWPALDDFYDFLLDLSPRRIEVSPKHRTHLRRYSRDAKLPPTYATLNEFVAVQIEAIMEELVASLRSSEQASGPHSAKHFQLTSVSPCGRSASGQQAFTSSQRPLNSSAIFMESGFSGSTANQNDYIVTFQPPHGSKKGSTSSDFVSGDLVVLRSPRWKSYEMVAYGVVLCNSVVAVGGGSSDSRRGSSRDSDVLCVLVRTHERDHVHPREDFSALIDLCLANPRSPTWKWRLEYVHNLTTSAREFQAMKSVAFFSPATKRSLLEGKLSSPKTVKQETDKPMKQETEKAGKAAQLAPALLHELEKKYNASQLDAILGCVGDERHVIIQGPVRRLVPRGWWSIDSCSNV